MPRAAFVTAHELGDFWGFALHSYARFEAFSVDVQPEWAETVGLDRERFVELLARPDRTDILVAGKREGLENGVDSTPAFFVEGRLYQGEIEPAELVDALEETYERAVGVLCEPARDEEGP